MNPVIRQEIIRSLLFSLSNGFTNDEFLSYCIQIQVSVDEIFALHHEARKAKNATFKKLVKDRSDYVIEKLNLKKPEPEKEECYVCKKSFDSGKLCYRFISSDDGKRSDRKVCVACMKVMENSNKWSYCSNHNCYTPTSILKCPLFKKCTRFDYCLSEECINYHCLHFHKKYFKREWRPVNRVLGGVRGKIIDSPIPVGLEIEVVGKDHKTSRKNIFKLDKSIGITDDASISQYYLGTEIQTPPSSLFKLENLTEKVCKALIDDGFVVNARCGFHAHFNLRKIYGKIYLNPLFYKSLLLAYSFFEKAFWSLLPKSRVESHYCHSFHEVTDFYALHPDEFEKQKITKIWYQTNDEKNIKRYLKEKNLRPEELAQGSRHHRTKFRWANFHSLFRGFGLEIRSLEGTLDASLILNWINLNQKFIEAVAMSKEPFVRNYKFVSENLGVMFHNSDTKAKIDLFKKFLEPAFKSKEDMELCFKFIDDRVVKSKLSWELADSNVVVLSNTRGSAVFQNIDNFPWNTHFTPPPLDPIPENRINVEIRNNINENERNFLNGLRAEGESDVEMFVRLSERNEAGLTMSLVQRTALEILERTLSGVEDVEIEF